MEHWKPIPLVNFDHMSYLRDKLGISHYKKAIPGWTWYSRAILIMMDSELSGHSSLSCFVPQVALAAPVPGPGPGPAATVTQAGLPLPASAA